MAFRLDPGSTGVPIGGSGSFGDAAALATAGQGVAIASKYGPNFGEMTQEFGKMRAEKDAAAWNAQAKTLGDLAQAQAYVDAAEAQASATRDAAQSQYDGKNCWCWSRFTWWLYNVKVLITIEIV